MTPGYLANTGSLKANVEPPLHCLRVAMNWVRLAQGTELRGRLSCVNVWQILIRQNRVSSIRSPRFTRTSQLRGPYSGPRGWSYGDARATDEAAAGSG